MAPPKKVSRGTGDVENDPERASKTMARAPHPPPEEDPERANATQAKVPNPLSRSMKAAKGGGDPERDAKTQARAPRPKRKGGDDDAEYRTGSDYGLDGEASDYHTGQSFQQMEEGEGLAGSGSLEGDGLDALDPEVGSHTKALPALERDEQVGGGDEEEGADDANATHAGPPIKLEIIAGPDAGKKRRFKGVRMIVGRTPGVDLQLSDQSVSRRHIELIHGDDGVVMRDLGSGNGTKVNGARIAEKKLDHGDEIAIGKTVIRFVDEVAAFKKAREEQEQKEAEAKAKAKAPAAGKNGEAKTEAGGEGGEGGEGDGAELAADAPEEGGGKKPRATRDRIHTSRSRGDAPQGLVGKLKALNPKLKLAIALGVGFLFLVIVLGLASRPPPAPLVDPNKVLADQKMQEARNAVREGNYESAVALVEEAEKLVPGIDKTRLGNTSREELAYVRTLDEARAFLENRRFEDARKALAKAEKGSGKSQELKAKLAAELDVAEVAYKKEKLQEFLNAGEVDSAKALLAELPVEEQAAPAEQIRAFEETLAQQEKEDALDEKKRAANAAAASRARREEEIAEAFRVVERKFAGGEWDRAGSECARVIDAYPGDKDVYKRAKMLQGAIPNFGRNYEEGMKKFKQGAIAQASKPLRLAHQLYRQIDLKANKYGQELEEKLGAASIAAGREALLRNDLVTAWQNFRDAAKFDPGDAKARDGLDQVSAKAEDLFQMAYVERDRDPREALRKFKVVVQVTDPGSTVHEKAKNQIAAMQP
ncbi:MAG: FHA domain-containing protein [Myxococcales bacterium]|nr:FHA domain-containing protein [Myxococcales bacterium]